MAFALRFPAVNRMVSASAQRLLGQIGWLTGAELVGRLGRIITAIILARQLDATAFGVAALAITVFELTRIFTENGIGAAVVRASEHEFQAVAKTAYQIMWAVCLGLCSLQSLIGYFLYCAMPSTDIGLMVGLLAGVYLIMPFGLVHAYMLQRQQRMRRLATVAATQNLTDHVLTALLAVTGFGAWAIVLPKLLTAPIWLIGVRLGRPWKRDSRANAAPIRNLIAFSAPVLGSELAVAVRDQADKLIVSALFGLEAVGLYYFAFNAGLGLSTALNRAFTQALYPFLCAAKSKGDDLRLTFRRVGLLSGLPLAGLYIIQAAAALIYVPIIFGSNWAYAAPLVALLCLGGPARLALDGARIYLRASGQSGRELGLSAVFAFATLLPLATLAPFGLQIAAVGGVISASLTSITLAGLIFGTQVTFARIGAH